MAELPIEVRDLRVKYGSLDAVRGLSFSVGPGEIVGFLGPNGAGKSSTLKAVMGFVTPSGGECKLFGLDASLAESRAHVGYLPEVALYYPYLTPLETLNLYGELQGLRGTSLKKEIVTLLEAVGIGGSMKKQNRQLSKGMLQRVGIAQSLLGQPKLLILDEVTSGLDPVGRQELRDLLFARQREGATLFFSSHELAEVDMLCDRILLINRGVLIEERRMTELRETLKTFKVRFAGTDRLGTQDEDGTNCAEFETKDELVAAINEIASHGGRVIDVQTSDGSLEDYFIEKVQAA